ncbi:MAG: S-layer homology domain-containing protein [Actinobacteria bacterium]|nr:S-layer homology domain-containing protein [Actinomycetota bacterium]
MRTRGCRTHGEVTGVALALILGLALALTLLPAVPAHASTAGWQVDWLRSPPMAGPAYRLSADAGRVVYLTGSGSVVLYDVTADTAETLTQPGVVAGLPVIEGHYVVWSTYTTEGHQGLILHDLASGEDRTISGGRVYDEPFLEGGRVLWLGGTNESIVLNLYEIETGTSTALNQGTPGWSPPLLLNEHWVVWREHQDNGQDQLFAYDTAAGTKRSFSAGTGRRMYALMGDQVVLSRGATPDAPGVLGLALFDLRRETFSAVPGPGESSIAYVATDEEARRMAWTAVEHGGPCLSTWDLSDQSLDRIPTPHYSLGPIGIAGNTVLFRGRPEASIFADAPMTLFAYNISAGTLTELGQLTQPSFPFTTDGAHAYWMSQVLLDGSPHLPPHWEPDLVVSPDSSVNLFVAAPSPSEPGSFADVEGLHPYRTGIVSLWDRGAVGGYPVGDRTEFRAQEPYLRAQFAKVMVEALGLPVDESLEAPFWDLGPDDPDSLYPHDYIAAAVKAGLIKGYPGGAFRPWAAISRAQLATLVVRAGFSLRPAMMLSAPDSYWSLLGAFDRTHGRNLALAQYNGLVDGLLGYGRYWDAWASASRGEGAQVLWNLLKRDVGEGLAR